MIDAYSSNAFNRIQNDLKIFCGKKYEIAKIQSQNAIVPNKIYLASDTGEIFIANQAGRLFQYGSSNSAVREIIETEMSDIIERINTVSETNANLNSRVTSLENGIGSELTQIINSAIERVLQSDEVKTLISNTVNSKIHNDGSFRNTLTEVISDQGFSTKTEVTDSIKNTLTTKTVQYVTGVGLQQALESANIGIYFCISDYTYEDNFGTAHVFTSGGFYEIYSTGLGEVNYKAIQIPNRASDFISPNIIVDETKVNIPYGTTLNNYTINYIIENYANVKEDSKLELRYVTTETINLFNDENENDSDNRPLARESGTITINKNVIVPPGDSILILSGTDKSNNTFEAYINIVGYAPLLYGTTSDSSLVDIYNFDKILNNNKDNTVVITPSIGDYLYILSSTRTDIYLNGVNITNMFDQSTINIPSDIYSVQYTVYKSKMKLSNESFSIDVRRA